MNRNAAKGATNRPITLNNESNLDNSVFSDTAPDATAVVAATDISPDAHLLPSGIKLDTQIFSKGNIKNMDDKDTIDTTTDYNVPEANTFNSATQYSGSTDSNSPYSLINRKFAPYSTSTSKTRISMNMGNWSQWIQNIGWNN